MHRKEVQAKNEIMGAVGKDGKMNNSKVTSNTDA